jgi:hypothetical protein
MRITRCLQLFVLSLTLATPALAQTGMGIPLNEDAKTLTPEEAARKKAADDAYRASLKQIPDAKPSRDPWGNVRQDTSSGPQQAAPKAKARRAAQPHAKAAAKTATPVR